MMRWIWTGLMLCRLQISVTAQTTKALDQLNRYLNKIGIGQTERRARRVTAIETRAEAERPQAEVRVEAIAYESVPRLFVTANVYVPEGEGPFPAVIVTPGHGAGEQSGYSWVANFARSGRASACSIGTRKRELRSWSGWRTTSMPACRRN